MEIEIIRDEDGQYCSDDVNMDGELINANVPTLQIMICLLNVFSTDDDRGGQSGINAERGSNHNFRKMGDEDLVDSYLSKNDNQQREIVHNFMSQVNSLDKLNTRYILLRLEKLLSC